MNGQCRHCGVITDLKVKYGLIYCYNCHAMLSEEILTEEIPKTKSEIKKPKQKPILESQWVRVRDYQ